MNYPLLKVLRIRPFLYLWLAEIFSQIAMNMVNFVLIIVAFKLSNSNAAVSGIVLSYTIPAVIFGLLAGVFVDRWNKKSVLFFTNVLRMILVVLLIYMQVNLVGIYILSFAISIVTQFFIPAETPMIPILVKKDLLLAANALFSMGIYGSLMVAYILSGTLLIFLEQEQVFIILSLFFLLAAFFVSIIRVPGKQQAKEKNAEKETRKNSIKKEIALAFRVIVGNRKISNSLVFLTLSQLLVLILAVIGPGFASEIMQVPVDRFPLLFVAPAAVGMVVGAVLIGNYFQRFSIEKVITFGLLATGAIVFLLPFIGGAGFQSNISQLNSNLPSVLEITSIHVLILLAFLLGFANAMVFVSANTVLQENTNDEFRGRAYGALNSMVGAFSLIPVIMAGELADLYGVSRVIMGIGVAIVGAGIAKIVFPEKI